VDRPKPRWVPAWFWPWLTKPWRRAILVVAVFAIVGVIFMLVSERKDSSYWAGYSDGQRWVHEGGYQAHEESIAAYCRAQAATREHTKTYEHGCVDGAHNAMR
jgi:hypothetical protein